jgi:hypothetical protein
MSDQFIQDDLALFILENIDSIAQLEALLLLRKNQQTNWSAPAVARWLYIDEKQTTQLLVALCHRGFACNEKGRLPSTSINRVQRSSRKK